VKRAAALALVLAACGPAAPPQRPFRVVAFGDSLTEGHNLPDPAIQAYPAVLEKKLRTAGWQVTVMNAGRSGDTTADALARLDAALVPPPSVVIVALGSNDLFQRRGLKEIEGNLALILDRVKAAGAVPVLCAMKTSPLMGFGASRGYARIFPRVAKARKALLTPHFLEDVLGHPSMNLSDGIHPNPAGYEKVMATVLPTVVKALKRARQ
jgi:acyl-CoA thioesterase-1